MDMTSKNKCVARVDSITVECTLVNGTKQYVVYERNNISDYDEVTIERKREVDRNRFGFIEGVIEDKTTIAFNSLGYKLNIITEVEQV